MREVMKWSKNYVTDEFIQNKVTKNSDSLIGRATIKVLDKNGNTKQEVVSENIIHDGFNKFNWYVNSFKDFVGSFNASYHRDLEPFYKLMLSTDDSEESETNITINGTTIGYANVGDTSSGTDVRKGAYDSVSSFTERTSDGFLHRHCVFEFGNAKANGTFNSVIFTYRNTYNSSTNSSSTPPFRIRKLPSITGMLKSSSNNYGNESGVIPSISHTVYKGMDCKFYTYSSSSYYEILNLERWINGIEDIKVSLNPNPNFKHYCLSTSDKQYIVCEDINVTGHKQGLETTYNLKIYNEDGGLVETINHSGITDILIDVQKYIDAYDQSNSSFNVKVTPHKYVTHSNGDITIIFEVYSGLSTINAFPSWSTSDKAIHPSNKTSTVYVSGTYSTKTKKWICKPSIDDHNSRYFAETVRYKLGSLHKFEDEYTRIEVNGHDYFIVSDTNPYTYSEEYMYHFDGVKFNSFNVSEILTKDFSDSASARFYIGVAGTLDGYEDTIILGTNLNHNYTSDSTNQYHIGVSKIVGHNSHTKLPSPVTKTEDDTMKIEYDYYIQIPNLLNPNGDHTQIPE